jgi:hypothetical protein
LAIAAGGFGDHLARRRFAQHDPQGLEHLRGQIVVVAFVQHHHAVRIGQFAQRVGDGRFEVPASQSIFGARLETPNDDSDRVGNPRASQFRPVPSGFGRFGLVRIIRCGIVCLVVFRDDSPF